MVGEAALPLTALVGGSEFESSGSAKSRRWWWPVGEAVEGAKKRPLAGREVAVRLGARVWIGSGNREGDGKKDRSVWSLGRGAGGIEDRRARNFHAGQDGRPVTAGAGMSPAVQESQYVAAGCGLRKGTKALELANGEEIVLTSEGVQNAVEGLRSLDGGLLKKIGAGIPGVDEVIATMPLGMTGMRL